VEIQNIFKIHQIFQKKVTRKIYYASNKEFYKFTPTNSGDNVKGVYKFKIEGNLNSYYEV